MSAEEIEQRILDEVLRFTRGLPQGDDITLIVLEVKGDVVPVLRVKARLKKVPLAALRKLFTAVCS